MKHIIILGDGMADEPCPELGDKTPIEAADTPALDRLAKLGRSGLLATVPDGFSPGSEIAHLSLLGYNLPEVFEGRGTLEAASMGIDIEPGEMAMRCNLICIAEDGTIKNHSAGHISTEEASELIGALNEALGDEKTRFFPGVSYRHLLKIKGGDKRILCTPPHDVPGTPAADVMVRPLVDEAAPTADFINDIIIRSREILENHPVNLRRKAEGKDPANSIWPWSPGYKPAMKTMQELFGIRKGYVISAVDLIMGIGVYAGLKPIHVEGATGLYDTNYEGKTQAAIEALKGDADFVFLHIEASDEAGHEGNAVLKKQTIESLDSRVVAPVMKAIEEMGEEVAVALLPDHPTPCRLRTHTSRPVPFVIWKPGVESDSVERYSEKEAENGGYGLMSDDEFIKELLTH
ncbi:MAG: cofactor-independent phosphoglycerate mutase [Muribaculaceae bacterium]|nr:cofactor-independent phosphoglycerate mutase [Muribaculaceae bacterium]